MRSKRFSWFILLVLAGLSGCAMCDNALDRSYSAFGGKWQRDNMVSGRVGSLFDPAGVQIAGQATLVEGEPTLAETETGEPMLAEPETAETGDAAAGPAAGEPAENAEQSEAAEEAAEDAAEDAAEETPQPAPGKPREQTPPSLNKPEKAKPKAAAEAASAGRAEPAAERTAPDARLRLPDLPGEKPQAEEPKEGGTNLLPPLELPPLP